MAVRGGQLPVVEGRDAEVGEDGAAVGPQQHVGRFHVTVQGAGEVYGPEGVEELESEAGGVRRGERPGPAYPGRQGGAPHQLHDDPEPVLGLDQVVHADHMGMRHPRDGPRLPHRTPHARPVVLVALDRDP